MNTELYPIYVQSGRSPRGYKAGFLDAGGRVVIEPIFEDVVLSSNGTVVGPPKYQALSSLKDPLAYVRGRSESYGFIAASGEELIPLLFENAHLFGIVFPFLRTES